MTISRVRGLLATPSRDEEFVTAGVPLLVGREEESGLLRRRWEQSQAGLGQVVFVSGEAGIGKSALVEGLRAQVRAEGLPRIAYRCSPYHTTSALYPMITHIEHLLQLAPDDPAATKLTKLEAGLRPYGLPLAEVVPLVARLLSIPLPVERYAPLTLTPQQQKQQTLAEAHTLMEQHDERWWEAEVYRLRGVVLLRQPGTPQAEAAIWLQRALDVARRQEAKSLELRAAMSLSRLWQQQGKGAAARALLAPIYGWFTEGFDTADLQEARALLKGLA